ncbi:uncharacterized protein LOC135819357 [Sycon ciliatum]|uniref:uncharacterized protein LOC135819357 n=1 Tax=Sycon ciliatum TaxID=27933 RepID=UPI0031F67390
MCEWLERNSVCKSCHEQLMASRLRHPGKALSKSANNISIRCDHYEPSLKGCPDVVSLHRLQEHVQECAFNPQNTRMKPVRSVRPSSAVADVLTASPSKLKGNIATNLTARLVTARVEEGRLEVKTGDGGRGKPQVYQLTPEGSVPSTEASASTLRRREAELTRIAESVCGGSDGARVQMIAGLKRLSLSAQEQLLQDAGLCSSTPAPGTALAIKADLQLPWAKLRKLRQWLKVMGITLESEQHVREFVARTLPKYTALDLPFAQKDGEMSMAAAVFFPDLISVVLHFLDVLKESDRLSWHSGAIPASEIWLKVGGDHGGGSFKLSMQIANTDNPNATRNTIPVHIFNEKDSAANLETALGQYRPQLEQLQLTHWEGKQIRVFLFGDYEFQTVNYGLSGAGGLRPCLHCHCLKTDMARCQEERCSEDKRPRSLQTLAHDHAKYVEAGSRLSHAKHFNNVIRHCILPVPISNAIIPILHLDLGIFKWMFDAMLKEIRELDTQIAAKCAAIDSDPAAFSKLCQLHAEVRSVELAMNDAAVQKHTIQQQLQFVALHAQQHVDQDVVGVVAELQQLHQTAVQTHDLHSTKHTRLLNDIQKVTGSKGFEGPCYSSVEPVLQDHLIKRQVYHSGSFVGNHVHRALQPTVVTAITSAHVPVVQTRCPELLQNAQDISKRYEGLMTGYASC